LVLLVTGSSFAREAGDGRPVGKFAPDLAHYVTQAQRGASANPTIKVIVQYKNVPQSAQIGRMHNLGGSVNARLNLVKGVALTIPVSALAALEADPEVLSVSIDHPMSVMDDLTNGATGVASAWSAGFNGAG